MKAALLARRLSLPTGWLYYLDSGHADAGAPAVFLHGWALSSAVFQDSLACLAEYRRVIGLDWPGFNRSTISVSGWRYEDFARAVGAFAVELRLPPFHLVGHSMGGAIAIAAATRFPEMVRSLTLIDSAGIPLRSFWRVCGRKMLEIPAQLAAVPHKRKHVRLAATTLHNFIFRAVNTYHCMQLPLYADLSKQLPLIRVPSLVAWGEDDGMVPAAFGRQLAQGIPGAQWVALPNAYHEWSVFQFELFAQVVEEFVSRH